MDLYKIIQLIKRHLFLLIMVPIIMAALVYFFTRNSPKSYTSETIIYTGIATSFNIESTEQRNVDYFATNIQYDNIINIVNSRSTIEKTAIRLLAQGLILDAPNPQYISKENYQELHRMVPKHVKDLVVINGKMGLEREKEQQILRYQEEIQELESEIERRRKNSGVISGQNYSDPNNKEIEIVSHVVRPGENIYQIAAIYGISAAELMDRNGMRSPDVTSGQTLIIKKNIPTNYLYHTVKEGETLYAISKEYNVSMADIRRTNSLYSDQLTPGVKLIIKDLRSNYKAPSRSAVNYEDVKAQALADTDADSESRRGVIDLDDNSSYHYVFKKDHVVPPGIRTEDFEATVSNLMDYYNSSDTNYVYGLLNYDHRHYSISKIRSNSQVTRINSSDLIRITYQSDDPGICQQTLKLLTQVFIRDYRMLKANQADFVVDYYRRKVEEADARLQDAEDRLLKFNQDNNIINYYEQSKAIAGQKEDLDLYYQNEQIKMAAASAVLGELETKLFAKDSIYVKSDAINQKMKEISDLQEKIVVNEISSEYDPKIQRELQGLKRKAKRLKDEMKANVDQLYLYTHSSEGIPIKDLLVEYLDNSIAYREAKASMRVLNRRKADFTTVYQIFAPLGAMLKRIEREIEVAEQAYMEFLHSFNVAKMKQQNNQMSANIKIMDEPTFPLRANPSKTKLLILAAAIIGFFMVAFIILMLEFFDTTIKRPETVEKIINLKLAGAYPILEPGFDNSYISNRLIEMILQNIKLHLSHNSIYTTEKPYLVLIFSTQEGVGKTLIAKELIKKLRSWGENVLYLNYSKDSTDAEESSNLDSTITYKIDNRFVEINSINELLSSKYLRQDNYKYDYIFLEIPALIYNSYPLELMSSVDAALMVTKATDHWRKADVSALEMMQEVCREKPMVVLNQTELFALEDIINEIPEQKRKSIRRKVRKIVTYPFRLKVKVRVD